VWYFHRVDILMSVETEIDKLKGRVARLEVMQHTNWREYITIFGFGFCSGFISWMVYAILN